MSGTVQLQVELNGTDVNPYHKYGITQNPFPQIASYERQMDCLHLQALGGDPILNADYIRNHLKGWSTEFIELCVSQFKVGEYAQFTATFQE